MSCKLGFQIILKGFKPPTPTSGAITRWRRTNGCLSYQLLVLLSVFCDFTTFVVCSFYLFLHCSVHLRVAQQRDAFATDWTLFVTFNCTSVSSDHWEHACNTHRHCLHPRPADGPEAHHPLGRRETHHPGGAKEETAGLQSGA